MITRYRYIVVLVPLAVTVWAAEGGQARAQTLNEGWSALEGKYRAVRGRVESFFNGEKVDPNDKTHLDALDLKAKVYTYQVYLDNLDSKPKEIDNSYQGFARDVNRILSAKDRQEKQPLAEVLGDKVGIHALEVLKFPQARPIHKLHNARVLAKAAELGQASLAGPLLEAFKDPAQTDGVRYYVLRGLGTLLAQERSTGAFLEAKPVLSREQMGKCAAAIAEFLEQLKGPAKNATQEEIDGFYWLRREAVRALAQIHTPAVNDMVRPALVLARFAGNDARIQPPPRVDERVEAALGLARMKPAQDDKQYQPAYAAGQIAKCLGAFAQQADSEFETKQEKQTRPWRADAARLKDALAVLKTNNEKNPFVTQIVDRATQRVLGKIGSARIDANEQTWWSSPQSDPPSKELFQGASDSTVKRAPSAEPAPEK